MVFKFPASRPTCCQKISSLQEVGQASNTKGTRHLELHARQAAEVSWHGGVVRH